MSWSNKYKRSIDCENPQGFSQRAHCESRKKRSRGEKTKSNSPFNEELRLKTHKTVEEIAKKHRLDISFIQKQLDMGEPIEHEHTKDHELAMDIALQHLDEIPDYYTRLKKMEADAKKEHKKFKDVNEDLRDWFSKYHPKGNWRRFNTKGEAIGPCAREPGEPKPKCLSNEKSAKMSKSEIAAAVRRKRKNDPVANRKGKGGKPKMVSNKINEASMVRYCPKCKKDETRDKCKYGQKYWDMFSMPIALGSDKKYTPNTPHPGNMPEAYDHEYSMARSELATIIKAATKLKKKMEKGEGSIEAWVQSKITKAADYIDTAADYVESGEMSEEWKQLDELWGKIAVGAGSLALPYILKQFKPVVDKAIDNQRKTSPIGGEKRVPQTEEYIEEKNVPTKPSLWSRAKSLAKQKFDVYPSAYANGWASKWYKNHGGGWKTVSEDCWDGYKAVGMKKKGKKMVPNCVPTNENISFEVGGNKLSSAQEKLHKMSPEQRSQLPQKMVKKLVGPDLPPLKASPGSLVKLADSYSNWRKELSEQIGVPLKEPTDRAAKEQLEKMIPKGEKVHLFKSTLQKAHYEPEGDMIEDWQSVNRKDKTDGLSQAAVDAYRRENPGSKLQTAVTEKNPKGKRAKRRANFCRRMKGMKSKLTSAKTARDPDSRINKALRRWRCN